MERALPRRRAPVRQGRPGLRLGRWRRASRQRRPLPDDGNSPIDSINFITAHDGFTLNDLVSYNRKHNEANGEDNRDGTDDNLSWNCGVEGETDDPEIEALRSRQVRNFLTILMLSQGVPMMVMGDEARQTQFGNNNAYCQDNEITWFDWARAEGHNDLVRFTGDLIAFRGNQNLPSSLLFFFLLHPRWCRARYFTGEVNDRGLADISWHGCRIFSPGWDDPESRVLAFTLGGFPDKRRPQVSGRGWLVHVMMNMDWQDLEFDVPAVPGRRWYRAVDTGAAAPNDIFSKGHETLWEKETYPVKNRSIVVLISKP